MSQCTSYCCAALHSQRCMFFLSSIPPRRHRSHSHVPPHPAFHSVHAYFHASLHSNPPSLPPTPHPAPPHPHTPLHPSHSLTRVVQKTYYSEEEARNAIVTILKAVNFMHSRNIVHRDMKPENLLLASKTNDSDVKIADFGFAIEATGETLTQRCGTPGYVAPEIIEGKKYGKTVDMWALGVICYILLGGYPPFHDENQRNLFLKIKVGGWTELPVALCICVCAPVLLSHIHRHHDLHLHSYHRSSTRITHGAPYLSHYPPTLTPTHTIHTAHATNSTTHPPTHPLTHPLTHPPTTSSHTPHRTWSTSSTLSTGATCPPTPRTSLHPCSPRCVRVAVVTARSPQRHHTTILTCTSHPCTHTPSLTFTPIFL